MYVMIIVFISMKASFKHSRARKTLFALGLFASKKASPKTLMPIEAVAFYGAGWQIHAENLAAYLAGRDRGETEGRWDQLVSAYQVLAADIGEYGHRTRAKDLS